MILWLAVAAPVLCCCPVEASALPGAASLRVMWSLDVEFGSSVTADPGLCG